MNTKGINLTVAELKAIEDHRAALSQQRGVEVTIDEAIADFIEHIAEAWRKEKLRRDNLDQREEIERHKYYRSLQEGRDVGKSIAAEEWCQKYAPIWRAERESLTRNGFQRATVTVQNEAGLHMRPVSTLATLAARFDCSLYVHKEGMVYYNFLLESRPYMNVRSILGFLSLGAALGDTLEFLATGPQATQALEALTTLLKKDSATGDSWPKAD